MASIPYMPLYIADYMADAAHLSTLEHGAYLLLIMTYWQRGRALPNSDERLANVARMSNEQWLAIKSVIKDFFTDDGDNWIHKRIDAELAHFRDKSAKASKAGKASAERRLNKRSASVKRTTNHTDTDTDTEEDREKINKKNFEDFFEIFPKQRKGSREKAEAAYRQALKRDHAETILNGLKSYIDSDEVKRGFAKGAAAWLNDDRWKNDYSQQTIGGKYAGEKRDTRSYATEALNELEESGIFGQARA
jgi:uncharacterized protein YdaU (DUF1376 family)